MRPYLLSLVATAAVAALAGFLSPKGNLGKYVKLVSTLLLLTVILLPLPAAMESLQDLPKLFHKDKAQTDAEEESLQQVLDTASKTYFAAQLTQRLEEKFEIVPGDLSIVIRWQDDEERSVPAEVTLLFSGKAKWKDPSEIESYVSDLLGCPCHSAIDTRLNRKET